MIAGLVVLTVLPPTAAAHDEVVPVENYYLVVNAEDGYVQIWEETNNHAGLQKEDFDCVFHPEFNHFVCQPPDTMQSSFPE